MVRILFDKVLQLLKKRVKGEMKADRLWRAKGQGAQGKLSFSLVL